MRRVRGDEEQADLRRSPPSSAIYYVVWKWHKYGTKVPWLHASRLTACRGSIWWARPDSNREPRDYEGDKSDAAIVGWTGSKRAPARLYAVFVLGWMRLKKAYFGPRVGTSTAQG